MDDSMSSGPPPAGPRRRDILGGLLGSTIAPTAVARQPIAPPAPMSGSPNILLVVSDQHRADLSKDTGYPFDTTPRLDALARAGVRFTHAYATAPLCVPSRISMLTGRWPQAHRVRMNLDARDAVYSADLYDVAKARGYRTGLAGKNHTYRKAGDLDFWREYSHQSGYKPPGGPAVYDAFDAWMRALGAGSVALAPTPFPLEAQYPYRIVSDAVEFIDQAGVRPFLLQVGFPEPHPPEQVPKPYWNMFPPDRLPLRAAGGEALAKLGYRANWLRGLEDLADHPDEANWRRYVSNYLGAMRMVDDQLARLVDHLHHRGIAENTLIVFLADHGDYVMDYGLGRKGVGLSDALARIPMVFAGAGVRAGSFDGVMTSNADVMPTLCEAMGGGIPIGVQGRSLWPLLLGQPYPADEFRSIYAGAGLGGLYYDEGDAVALPGKGGGLPISDTLNKVTQSGTQAMVRMGEWKLIYDMMGYGQLYDLAHDPLEVNNLFGRPSLAGRQAELMAELARWSIRTQDSLPTGPQNGQYQTKWARPHNWYAPHAQARPNTPFVP